MLIQLTSLHLKRKHNETLRELKGDKIISNDPVVSHSCESLGETLLHLMMVLYQKQRHRDYNSSCGGLEYVYCFIKCQE